MNYIQYQEYSDECESSSICSWEFIAGDATSEDGSIGTCVYNGGSGYYNPCVDCEIEIIPLSPTVRKVLLTCLTAHRIFDVPEVFDVHVIPSDEERIVPLLPTATKVLSPKVTL